MRSTVHTAVQDRPHSLTLKRVTPCHSSGTSPCTRFGDDQRARNDNWQRLCHQPWWLSAQRSAAPLERQPGTFIAHCHPLWADPVRHVERQQEHRAGASFGEDAVAEQLVVGKRYESEEQRRRTNRPIFSVVLDEFAPFGYRNFAQILQTAATRYQLRTGGVVTTSFGNNATTNAAAIAIQSDDKILAAGTVTTPALHGEFNTALVIARYLAK